MMNEKTPRGGRARVQRVLRNTLLPTNALECIAVPNDI